MSQIRVLSGATSVMGYHRRVAMPALLILAVVLALVAASSAAAAPKSIGGFIGGAALVDTGGLYTQPRDVAVYTAGTPDPDDDKIFVTEAFVIAADTTNNRVTRLDAHGNFELLWGKDVISPGFPGNTGQGPEICTAALTGAAGCKFGDDGDQAGALFDAIGIAVNQATGHVYVMDSGNHRVQEFDLDGHFVRAWGWDVVPDGQPGDTGSGFEVCTVECQAGAAGAGAGQFADSSGFNTIAMSPAAPNDLFVADSGNRRILQFESDGEFVRGWGWGVDTETDQFEVCTAASTCQQGLTGAPGRFAEGSPKHVVVDPDGIVYASDAAGDRIVRFDSDPAPSPPSAAGTLLDPLLSPALLSAGETKGLEIDPATGNLLAARDPVGGVTVVDDVTDPGTAVPSVADTHAFSSTGDVQGLGWQAAKGNIYLTVTALFPPPSGSFTGCGAVFLCAGAFVLADSSGPLAADLAAPTDVGTTTASLEGIVDPGGGVARYRFQVSSDGANWVDAAEPAFVSGSGPVGVSVEASGLEPATLYRTRLLISKQTGISTTETAISNEDVFLTDAAPPEVSTLGPSNRTDSSVRLRGRVDPQGSATSYRFEYGPAGGSFDKHVPIPDAQAGSGNAARIVSQQVSGLQPDTAYHYRVVASNSVGTAIGDAVAFTTRPETVIPPPAGRAYELVSTGDKLSGVGVGIWFMGPSAAGFAGYAAYEEERFAIQGTWGAVLVDGKYSLANDWALSERTPQGWAVEPLLSRRAYGAHPVVFIDPSAATPSLSVTSWGGTTVKLFAEMENWEKQVAGSTLYLRDWEGRWELFGPTHETQGGGPGLTTAVAISRDGKAAIGSGMMRGLAGLADPTLDQAPATSSVYLDEIPNGPSDTFPGPGVRSPIGICDEGTRIPRRLVTGKLGDQECVAAASERQSIAVDATGGSFTLTFDGQSTGPIAFNSPATGPGSLHAALEALPNVDDGDIDGVTGGPGDLGATSPYLVRFDPALGDVSQMSADGTALTGSGATATVQTVPVPLRLVSLGGAALAEHSERMIASDGSRVFFISPDPIPAPDDCAGQDAETVCPAQLYVRQRNSDDEVVTRWISRSEVTAANGALAEQDAGLMHDAVFQAASTDGDKVLFQTLSPLTADDPNGEGQAAAGGVVAGTAHEDSGDLYMYDMPDALDADPADGDLTRISAGPTGDSECNAPAGTLRFASDDGSRLYFACHDALDGVPVAGDGTSTAPADGTDAVNLYAYDAARPQPQRWRFVARIPTALPIGPCATTATNPGGTLLPAGIAESTINIADSTNCVRGTPDGSLITLWTAGQLTDDDPDGASGDVYAYDADEDELLRVSAVQGGIGGSYTCAPGSSGVQCYGDGGIGSGTLPSLGVAQDPDGGKWMVFFQSKARLIPGDQDSHYDVYQYRDGELSLISSNAPGTGDALLKGNDRTGTNVYLATRDRLSWQDKDSVLDIYSARIGDGIPEPPDAKEPCNPVLDQCQGSGGSVESGQTDSDDESAGNPPSAGRIALTLAAPSAKARRKAARTGALKVRVTTTGPTTVKLTAKARIGKKTRRVALATKQAQGAGAVTLTLRLDKAARKRLRAGKTLRITLTAGAAGSRSATASLRLRR